jgi:hypothetical protein
MSAVLGVMLLNASGNAILAQDAAKPCTSEECACEEALRRNTVEALEEFRGSTPKLLSWQANQLRSAQTQFDRTLYRVRRIR